MEQRDWNKSNEILKSIANNKLFSDAYNRPFYQHVIGSILNHSGWLFKSDIYQRNIKIKSKNHTLLFSWNYPVHIVSFLNMTEIETKRGEIRNETDKMWIA